MIGKIVEREERCKETDGERENISIIIRFFDNDQKLRIELLLRMTPLIHHNLIFTRKKGVIDDDGIDGDNHENGGAMCRKTLKI